MANRDAVRSAIQTDEKDAAAGVTGDAPLARTPEHGDAQGRADRPGTAAEDAEREQERQLADGTENPG